MVDQTNLNTANALNGELQQINVALDIFDKGGRITNMTVASAIDQLPARQTAVQTAMMAYPQTMVDAIKQYLGNREQEIRNELTGLGVTGVNVEIRAAQITATSAPATTTTPTPRRRR